ncbi:hypothetical protein Ade02nite_21800 [Paractinoplanes deccanensis]|uniref:DUF1579 domain-containing protein n=1 Tax=Paractinoplanes deccanensis TaxID=113561 RepID=A0ABQ3Y0K8_9ACTN|nr:hypothetical protein [Actinoplanes deccanensis]GID73539.1 hypothetical protein Ade02nite_21800 [Actinoplanes deccanensis]
MTFAEELAAAGPWAGHEDEMELYGRLVGTWDLTNRYRVPETGEWRAGTVVWTFGWVLAGHTVQDVMWFTEPGAGGWPVRMTGSTVRHYDPGQGVWHIVWFSPAGRVTRLTGRAGKDGDIEQEGVRDGGTAVRWVFTEMTATSFRWLGYTSEAGGDWALEQEMLAARRA